MSKSPLAEARRAPGSEWIKQHPRALERLYLATSHFLKRAYPTLNRISPRATARAILWTEEVSKRYAFNCQMCGQCVLHSTGMTCPMNCPKNLRNGPCGGVRPDGTCEVVPDLPCIWVQAWERSQSQQVYRDAITIMQPPVDRTLQNTSAWINMLEGRDTLTPKGW
jgi:hypothetical protein